MVIMHLSRVFVFVSGTVCGCEEVLQNFISKVEGVLGGMNLMWFLTSFFVFPNHFAFQKKENFEPSVKSVLVPLDAERVLRDSQPQNARLGTKMPMRDRITAEKARKTVTSHFLEKEVDVVSRSVSLSESTSISPKTDSLFKFAQETQSSSVEEPKK